MEYCSGDHFLSQFGVWLQDAPSKLGAKPVLPNAWHQTDRWQCGFQYADSALQELICMLRSLDVLAVALQSERLGNRRGIQTWLADSAAWLQSVVASVVRDTYVHPRRAPINSRPQPTHAWRLSNLLTGAAQRCNA